MNVVIRHRVNTQLEKEWLSTERTSNLVVLLCNSEVLDRFAVAKFQNYSSGAVYFNCKWLSSDAADGTRVR